MKLNSEGKVIKNIYTCFRCSVTGLLVVGDLLYIIHYNGTLLQARVSDGRTMSVFSVPTLRYGWVKHTGSLYSNPDTIPDKDTLILCDSNEGEVFSYNLSTKQKQIRLNHTHGLTNPYSVSYFFQNNMTFFIVCDISRQQVNVYNATWQLVRNIGRPGSADGELKDPSAAIVSEDNTIIVSETGNHRVSEFSFGGKFLGHLLVKSDGIYRPNALSFSYPYLYLTQIGQIYRYRLYE